MRVSNQYVINSFLRVLNRNQEELNRTQIQVSSGKQIQRASESPVNNALSMHSRTQITEHTQYAKNIARTQEWLENTDTALSSIETTLQRVRELAVQGANDTLVQTDRDAIAKEIEELTEHLVDIANTDIGGEFLFAGHDVNTKPFEILTGLTPGAMRDVVTYSLGTTRPELNTQNIYDVRYRGDENKLVTEIEKGVLLQKNVNGAELFFRGEPISPAPTFGSRLPPLNQTLPLGTLNGGRGVQPGIIDIKDSNGIWHRFDLKSANRLDDVIYTINATGSFESGIEEVPSDTALALGLYRNAGPTNELIGLADPAMEFETTQLTKLNNGLGVPAGFLSINTRDGRNTRIDISAAVTVKDVMDLINGAEGGTVLKASFDLVHRRLEIKDLTGGTGEFSIESKKNQFFLRDLPAKTASDLGLLTNAGGLGTINGVYDPAIESEATPLSALNGGKGVERGYIDIDWRNGTTSRVDLTNAASVQGVVDAINAAAAATVPPQDPPPASFDLNSKRIIIDDRLGGAGDFEIREVDNSAPTPPGVQVEVREITTIAKNLGLLKSSQSNTVIGDPLAVTPPVPMTVDTLLSTLDPPIDAGSIIIRGSDDVPVTIDLAKASTIGDVLTAINSAGSGFDATFDAVNQRFTISLPAITGAKTGMRVEEYTNTARDLGLVQGTMNHTSSVLTGAPIAMKSLPTLMGSIDLDPAVTRETELSALNSGRTFNKGTNLGFIRITDRAGHFKAIDLRGCKTIGDALDKINDPSNGLYIEARINGKQNGIEIVDQNHGAAGHLEIVDVDSSTAADLGIAGDVVSDRLVGRDIDPAVRDNTLISALRVNEGGIPLGKVFIQSGDFSGEIDLTGVTTIGELMEKLSRTDNRFNLAAWIDTDGKRLNLTNTAGQPYIKVRDLDEGKAASALGLGGSRSLFETLGDLRDSLQRNDPKAVSEQSIKTIQEDLERVLKFHAEVGVKVNRTTASKEKQESLTLNLNKMLDVVENVDMTEAITRMTQMETAFRAALQSGARILELSLMEFLK